MFALLVPHLQGYVQPMRAGLPRPCLRGEAGLLRALPATHRQWVGQTRLKKGAKATPTQGAWEGALFCPRGTQGPGLSSSYPEDPRWRMGFHCLYSIQQTPVYTYCMPGTQGGLKRGRLHSRKLWLHGCRANSSHTALPLDSGMASSVQRDDGGNYP